MDNSRLRLGRILRSLGIDATAYLGSRPLVDVEQQLRTCANCKATHECDTALDKGTVDTFEFCDNKEALSGLRTRLHGG